METNNSDNISKYLKEKGSQEVPERLWYKIEDTISNSEAQSFWSIFTKPKFVSIPILVLSLMFSVSLGSKELLRREANLFLTELSSNEYEDTTNYENYYF